MQIQQSIEQKLQTAFAPEHLEVINESAMHNVPPGSESHFKVVVVSQQFDGVRLLQRHRKVNTVLEHELQHHIHALALHTLTTTEWQQKQQAVPSSPDCLGGSKR